MLHVLGVQFDNLNAASVRDRDINLERAGEIILARRGFDLYVLPELSSSGYARETFTMLNLLAEDGEGPSYRYFSSLARKVKAFICFGFPRATARGYTISQAVVNVSGELVALYDKIHLAQFGDASEKEFFVRGDKVCAFKLGPITVGIIICYDIRFPEQVRELALGRGVDLVLHPVAFARDDSFPSWHPFVITRALENQVCLLSVNRAGRYYGSSIFCPPWVGYTEKPSVLGVSQDVLPCVIDLDMLSRIRKQYSFRADRLDYYK